MRATGDSAITPAGQLHTAGVTVALAPRRGLTHDFIKTGRAPPAAALAQALATEATKFAWSAAP